MKEFLSVRDQRITSIIEFLLNEPKTTISVISKATNISVRTVSSSIPKINEIIYPCIINTDFFGVELAIPKGTSSRHILNQIIRHSVELGILENILIGENCTLQELSNMYYVSENTVRRSILHINKNFKYNGIDVSIKNFKLVGNIKDAIIFFIVLFSEKYYFVDEFMSSLQFDALSYIVDNSKSLEIKVTNPQDKRRILIWMFVKSIIYRDYDIEQESCIDFPISLDHVASNKFESAFNTPLNNDILNFCFSFLTDGSFAMNYSQAIYQTKSDIGWHILFENIIGFITTLSDKYKIKLQNADELIVNLFNILRFPARYSHILYSRDEVFLDRFSTEFPSFYETAQKEVNCLFQGTLNNQQKSELLYLVFSHWSSLFGDIKANEKKVAVGVYTDSDWEHSELLSDFIVTNNQDIAVIKKLQPIVKSKLIHSLNDIDLLVTNIPNISHKSCRII